MDKNFDFAHYNPNFDHEMTDNNEWLNVHIDLLFNELKDIQIAIYIFNTVDKEWDKRVQSTLGKQANEVIIKRQLWEKSQRK